MTSKHPDRPYFEAWLRRTRRQFAISGRLSQVAAVFSSNCGETTQIWRQRLRDLLEGGEPPSLDLLMEIDLILAKPGKKPEIRALQTCFF